MRISLCRLAATLFAMTPAALFAQPNASITPQETAARRNAIAARIDSGVIIAFGGRALVHDFSTFYQLPAFRYLTELNEPDAALVMVVRNKRALSTLFLTPLDARTAFYYGVRVDSTTSMAGYGMPGRSSAALPALVPMIIWCCWASKKRPIFALCMRPSMALRRCNGICFLVPLILRPST